MVRICLPPAKTFDLEILFVHRRDAVGQYLLFFDLVDGRLTAGCCLS